MEDSQEEPKKQIEDKSTELSKKDKEFREFTLNGSMWKVIWQVAMPLCLYQCLGQVFGVLDTMMASHISSNTVSAVAYLAQINSIISAVGGGLAIGASLKISEAYGQGKYDLLKKRVSTLYAMCGILSVFVLMLIPFANQVLAFAKTPVELIAEGSTYFRLQLFGMVVSFVNNVFIAIERARGETKLIMKLNIVVILAKTFLTALFVYVLHGNIVTMSLATIISQSLLMIVAVVRMKREHNAFGFSIKYVSFKKHLTWPMIVQSIPLIVERSLFSAGKLMVNSMSTLYGVLTVGALGVSNNLGGFAAAPQNGLQEGAASVISQNIGAGRYDRAMDAFKKVMVYNVAAGAIAYAIAMGFLPQISSMFAKNNPEFQQLIAEIFTYEAMGFIPLGINSSVMALLYGLGKTKISLIISMSRVFIFRVPVLWFLQQYTSLGSESVGIVMMVSNVSVAFVAILAAVIVIKKDKKRFKMMKAAI
ncbi:MATE family efflux transporter [Murimonas intestini]|uniref:MATE family efflux protein n=1 Tax=Murimonas intestini TaxID=1337051 RepID=A0AB73SXX2_9FIRM|nr:MATE family efflux transporter [Murimonas intestini]MCR1843344.1 MATE family efflux transporter [Murimonas intestini]MCR1865705.1 MATE family efflux transporter [Murimonas intestini]MCR1886176.1 MATE family efflux transporter [Murimonas intestini]